MHMEFHEKLQELRKQKGFTQEQLAELLFVSRTAISKWESGRGYPNIDSLKAIAKLFSVSIDDLLSGEELLVVAEVEHKQKKKRLRDLLFGLLDICSVVLFFLPLFGQNVQGNVQVVSLLALTGIPPYLKFAYIDGVTSMILCGVLTLALQNSGCRFWEGAKHKISLIINVLVVLLLILSRQPYGAILLFIFLIIKVLLFVKE